MCEACERSLEGVLGQVIDLLDGTSWATVAIPGDPPYLHTVGLTLMRLPELHIRLTDVSAATASMAMLTELSRRQVDTRLAFEPGQVTAAHGRPVRLDPHPVDELHLVTRYFGDHDPAPTAMTVTRL
jgi:hypothetical protein